MSRGLPSEQLPQVSAFSVVLVGKVRAYAPPARRNRHASSRHGQEFAPEKVGELLRIVATAYKAEGTPTRVLELYLKTFTLGKVSAPAGSWAEASFDPREPLLAGGSLGVRALPHPPSLLPIPAPHPLPCGRARQELVRSLGVEAVLLWHALLIKRRVLVFGADRQRNFAALRALPRLVWHRQDWSLLRPHVTAAPGWDADLGAAAVYCAATTDTSLRGRSDLFDVVVDRAPRGALPVEAPLTLGRAPLPLRS